METGLETQCVVVTEELAWLGSIPRSLTLNVSDQDPDVALPASIPTGFHGDIDMAAPQLLVEICNKKIKHSSSSDDDDDSSDVNECGDDDDGTVLITLDS